MQMLCSDHVSSRKYQLVAQTLREEVRSVGQYSWAF
jgi:hypothetical protein